MSPPSPIIRDDDPDFPPPLGVSSLKSRFEAFQRAAASSQNSPPFPSGSGASKSASASTSPLPTFSSSSNVPSIDRPGGKDTPARPSVQRLWTPGRSPSGPVYQGTFSDNGGAGAARLHGRQRSTSNPASPSATCDELGFISSGSQGDDGDKDGGGQRKPSLSVKVPMRSSPSVPDLSSSSSSLQAAPPHGSTSAAPSSPPSPSRTRAVAPNKSPGRRGNSPPARPPKPGLSSTSASGLFALPNVVAGSATSLGSRPPPPPPPMSASLCVPTSRSAFQLSPSPSPSHSPVPSRPVSPSHSRALSSPVNNPLPLPDTGAGLDTTEALPTRGVKALASRFGQGIVPSAPPVPSAATLDVPKTLRNFSTRPTVVSGGQEATTSPSLLSSPARATSPSRRPVSSLSRATPSVSPATVNRKSRPSEESFQGAGMSSTAQDESCTADPFSDPESTGAEELHVGIDNITTSSAGLHSLSGGAGLGVVNWPSSSLPSLSARSPPAIPPRPTASHQPFSSPGMAHPSSAISPPLPPPSLPSRKGPASAPDSLAASPTATPTITPPLPPPMHSAAVGARTVSPSVSQVAAPPLPDRPRPEPTRARSPADAPGATLSLSDPEAYKPPPPPLRTLHVGEKPPARRLTPEDGGSSSSEDEDRVPPAAAKAKAMMEEMPDTTTANRRPPLFVNQPLLYADARNHFNAFAVTDRWIVTGSHHVKVFNMDLPLMTTGSVRQVDTVGESKEEKITAMAFKVGRGIGSNHDYDSTQGAGAEDMENLDGRYLWCGTNKGQLWELDLETSSIVDVRHTAHSSAVIGIYRGRADHMVTLDESGKMQIWPPYHHHQQSSPSPSPSPSADASTPVSKSTYLSCSPRTQRIALDASKQGGLRVLWLGNRLWVSTGPAGSKTALATGKGPSIRIYEPVSTSPSGDGGFNVTPRPIGIPHELATGVGAVTAGTLLPSQPGKVFLGHETGHVSIWEDRTPLVSVGMSDGATSSSPSAPYVCVAVHRITTSQVTTLAGVTRYLWAGYRSGAICVYDFETRPWRVKKMWKAHKEPVTRIVVEPSRLDSKGQLRVVSAGMDWCVRVWDGLCTADWFEHELWEQEARFCTYRPLRVLITTWNVDAATPADLATRHAEFGVVDNIEFLSNCLRSVDSPDIIVFGFQELIDLENKKLTAKTMLLSKKKTSPMSDSVSAAYRLWYERLVQAVRLAMPPECPYTVVHAENLVGLFTCVFIKNAEHKRLRDIAVTTVKTGMGGRYGNKGAIVARMVVDDTSLCFVNCHLAAGQRHVRQRNNDVMDILEAETFAELPTSDGCYVGGGDGSMVLDHEICFLNGDLNYRIDLRREECIRAIAERKLEHLRENDQLLKELKNNPTFRLRSFTEQRLDFDPTYKYDRGTQNWDSSEKARIPAWCDRILYRCPRQERIVPHFYKRFEPTVSDHRPVSAAFDVTIKAIDMAQKSQVEDELVAQWLQLEHGWIEEAGKFYRETAP